MKATTIAALRKARETRQAVTLATRLGDALPLIMRKPIGPGRIGVAFSAAHRTVHRVEREVAEERPPLGPATPHPRHRLVEEDIRGVT